MTLLAALLACAYSALPQTSGAGDATAFTGIASWYGPGFAGRPTSSGEIYDPSRLTAAHRSLPFGTYLLVRDLDSGASVVVRVNDRGPFARDRVIDLSEAAAQILGMIPSGIARVSCSIIPREEALAWSGAVPSAVPSAAPLAAPQAAAPAAAGQASPARAAGGGSAAPVTTHVRIQVASYASEANARATLTRLRSAGLEAVIERSGFHVRVVFPSLSVEEARAILLKLDDLGYHSPLVTSWEDEAPTK